MFKYLLELIECPSMRLSRPMTREICGGDIGDSLCVDVDDLGNELTIEID